MNKKTIITILLALVAMAGRAQVKSGLDLCLRDEATGEWLIGLFDDYAIYDCDYWDYAEAEKDHVVLTKDGLRKEIRLKKNTITIDGRKHKTSVLTARSLPDYPSKDETAWPSGIPAEEDSVTLRVCVNTYREKAEFVTFINRMFNDKQVKELTSVDALGRFEVRMPVVGPAVMGIFSDSQHPLEHTLWRLLAVEGGDTLLLYMDDKNDRTYVMGGKFARFNNELIGCDFQPDFVRTDEQTIDSTIVQQRHYMEACHERMDSLYASRPNLSRRFRTYYQDYIQYQFAYPMLLKCCWPSAGESQNQLLQKTEAELNPLKWTRSELPLMCRYGFGTIIKYYVSALTDIRQTSLTDPSDFIMQLYQDGKVQLSDDELQKVKSFQTLRANYNGDVDLNNAFQSDIIPILGKPLITQYWDWEQSERSVPIEVSVINSLDLDEATREILKTHTFMKDIDGKSHVASPRVMELAHQEIHHPRLIQAIDDTNQRIADFLAEQLRQQKVAPESGTPASRRVAEEELKGITDGNQLFDRIVAPFRNYVVYVDVWGTWCGPCCAEMEYVPDLKKRLVDKPVVYLYFCNNSPEDAWRTFISQKHLDTDNAVHYNLPKAQESAIEQYLEVSGFPTYRLVDTAGRLMPGAAPRPSNLSGTVSAIEQLLNP
ncbi:MAG: TlpA family protein disulfide reductase [Bacteroidaceae bacterium]|nr:TlpA family protein disulfide reductase [Bacteroidaceae bacterium]